MDAIRDRVLELHAKEPELTAVQLHERLGISSTRVREILGASADRVACRTCGRRREGCWLIDRGAGLECRNRDQCARVARQRAAKAPAAAPQTSAPGSAQ